MKPKTDLQELNSNEIKNIEKNLLEVFADFCEKNNLTYYISFGTLIGAVRHKGFIPWDDDIDLEMPRKDYNRLMEILLENNNHFTENIELKTPYSKKYQYPFLKVIDNTTLVIEKTMKIKYKTSVWIDIFPLDKLPDSEEERESFISKAEKLSKYYFYTIERKFSGTSLIGKIKFNLVRALLTPLYAITNQKQKIDRFIQKYKNSDTQYCSELVINYKCRKYKMDKSDLQQTRLSFENKMYTTYKNYDKVLKSYYGDYTILPPEENRVLTHSFKAYKIHRNKK